MARGAKKGSSHFEDWEMNPGTGKGKHADPPKKEFVEKRGQSMDQNMSAKHNDPNYKPEKEDKK